MRPPTLLDHLQFRAELAILTLALCLFILPALAAAIAPPADFPEQSRPQAEQSKGIPALAAAIEGTHP